jgi:uncharacterized protein YjbI with pentapeptide repeats
MKTFRQILEDIKGGLQRRIFAPLSPVLKHWTESVQFITQFLVPGRIRLKEEFRASEFGKAVAEGINRAFIAVIIILGLLLVAVFFRIWESSTWEKLANSITQLYRQIASSPWHVFFLLLLLLLAAFAAGVWVARRSSTTGGETKPSAPQENDEQTDPPVANQPPDSAPNAQGDTDQPSAPATEVATALASDIGPSPQTEVTVPATPEGAAIPKPEFTLPKPDGTALGKLLQRVPFLIIGTAIASLFFAFAWAASHISGPIASFIAAFIALGALMVLIRATWHWLTGLTWADFTKKARRVTADVLIDWVVPPIHQAKAQQEAKTLLAWADEIQTAQSQLRLFRLLVNGAVVIGGSMLAYITLEKLTEQNQVAVVATLTTIIDQQFQEESAEAEQAYLEIRDILLRSTSTNPSSHDEQVYALRNVAAAMLKKVTKAKEVTNKGSKSFSVVREASYPNIPKLKSLLRYFIVIDRIAHAIRIANLTGSNKDAFDPKKLTKEQQSVVANLMPVTNQLMITLHELGPRLDNQAPYAKNHCLWNWDAAKYPSIPPPLPRTFGMASDAEPFTARYKLVSGAQDEVANEIKFRQYVRRFGDYLEVDIHPLIDLRHLEPDALNNGSFPAFDPFRALYKERPSGKLGRLIVNTEASDRNELANEWGALRLAEGQSANYSNWTGSNLARSCLSGALIQGGVFDFSFLSEVSLVAADLSKSRFGNVELSGNLDKCNLHKTLWLGGHLWDRFSRHSTIEVSATGNKANFSDALFIGTQFEDIQADMSDLTRATFMDCAFRRGSFNYSNASGADFWMCRLGEMTGELDEPPVFTFVGATLVDTNWGGTFLSKVDFRGGLIGANCWYPGSETFPKVGHEHHGAGEEENPIFWYDLYSEGFSFVSPVGPSTWGEVKIAQPWSAFEDCVFGPAELCLLTSGEATDQSTKQAFQAALEKLRKLEPRYEHAEEGTRLPLELYDEIVKVIGKRWVIKASILTELDGVPELSTSGQGMNGNGETGAFGEEGIWIDSRTLQSMKDTLVKSGHQETMTSFENQESKFQKVSSWNYSTLTKAQQDRYNWNLRDSMRKSSEAKSFDADSQLENPTSK